MKKGFTLIEIMIVIVILGVLAAIGVPKLFGQMAKAKVSEVLSAAATYVSLQDAYQHEKTIIGNWNNIGYVAPGANGVSTEFQYSGCLKNDIQFTGEKITVIGWKATNRNNLNLCNSYKGIWAVQITAEEERNLNYSHVVNSPDCGVYTTNWAIESISKECENVQKQPSNNPEPDNSNEPEPSQD